jgi:FkbM family methyltransferase
MLVAKRARMIQELPEGAMLAVTLSEDDVRPFVADGVSLSAISGTAMTVLAGPVSAIERCQKRLIDAGHVCRRLPTTHAFHSDMMLPLVDRLTTLVRSTARQAPSIPCMSNVTGSWVTKDVALDDAYWSRHMCMPVRFSDGIREVGRLADHPFLEVGPGQTLTSLVMQHAAIRSSSRHHVVPCMRHSYDAQPDAKVLLRAVGRAWLAGVPVEWRAIEGANDVAADAALSSALKAEGESAREAAPPSRASETAEAILAVCRKVLKAPNLSMSDSIFEAGANSLVATQLIFEIRKLFKVELRLRKIYAAPTVAQIAALVESQTAPAAGGNGPTAASAAEDECAELASTSITLPNGLTIEHFNEVETAHFYEDIFAHRSYVKHGITLGEKPCVFDVGGNIGLFSLFILTEFPDARVYTFEPAPPNYELLCKNTRDHQDRIQLFNCGLSDARREAKFTFYPYSTGMSSFYGDRSEEQDVLLGIMRNQIKRGEKQIEELIPRFDELSEQRFTSRSFVCNLTTLSSIVEKHAVERIDLVKIDVQKAELDVLRGVEERHWPRIRQIVMEVHDLKGQKDEVVELLANHGYEVHVEQDDLYQGTVIYNVYAVRAAV